jgi:hypothetical protein
VIGCLGSMSVVVEFVVLLQRFISLRVLRILAALFLMEVGLSHWVQPQYPRWVGTQVGFRDLTLWSFLMTSGHGVGLMLIPVVLAWPSHGSLHSHYSMAHAMGSLAFAGDGAVTFCPLLWIAAAGVHTFGYLLVLVLVALAVYERLGISILRQTWVNLDLIWAVALFAAGILTFLT